MEPMSKMKILLCIGEDTVMFASKESETWKIEKEYVEIEDVLKLFNEILAHFPFDTNNSYEKKIE